MKPNNALRLARSRETTCCIALDRLLCMRHTRARQFESDGGAQLSVASASNTQSPCCELSLCRVSPEIKANTLYLWIIEILELIFFALLSFVFEPTS